MFSRRLRLKSNRLLGRRLGGGAAGSGRCHICRNAYHDMKPLLDMMLERTAGYEFETFLVGTQIKPSVIDRDDRIRSRFRLAGTDGIKTDITRELSRLFSKSTGKKHDALDPDLTITVNLRDRSCRVWSKSILVGGQYTKTARGLPQRQQPCANCSGHGCHECDFHGITTFESIEGRITRALVSRFGCGTIRFTWIGGEDRSSLVLGPGRPFFARMQSPSRRRPRLARIINLDGVMLHNCRILKGLPRMPVRFRSAIRIRVSGSGMVSAAALRRLKPELRQPVVVYDDSGSRATKSVSCVRYRRISGTDFALAIDAEGGLPVKRFVEGADVNPSVSKIVGVPCICTRFDFVDVHQ